MKANQIPSTLWSKFSSRKAADEKRVAVSTMWSKALPSRNMRFIDGSSPNFKESSVAREALKRMGVGLRR